MFDLRLSPQELSGFFLSLLVFFSQSFLELQTDTIVLSHVLKLHIFPIHFFKLQLHLLPLTREPLFILLDG